MGLNGTQLELLYLRRAHEPQTERQLWLTAMDSASGAVRETGRLHLLLTAICALPRALNARLSSIRNGRQQSAALNKTTAVG
jgi:hypothetical protein